MNAPSYASLLLALLLTLLSACSSSSSAATHRPRASGPTLSQLSAQTPEAKLALVSYSINEVNYGDWVLNEYMMRKPLAQLLEHTERMLGRRWELIPAADFVPTLEYQELQASPLEVAQPKFGDYSMRLFSSSREQLVAARTSRTRAAELARATGADLVALVYIEWDCASGFMTMVHPIAKVVISIYDAQGNERFHVRQDHKDQEAIGARPFKNPITPASVGRWTSASRAALNEISVGKGGHREMNSMTQSIIMR